ncbi:MAG: hypothetical protein CM15mP102_21220 [Flavobacteriales bacterium]|nr:MAG: hypothetical protein CM15mP102_21220 [Flavobacteriales bacterium]
MAVRFFKLNYSITINSNTTLEALFSEVVTQYSLTVSAGVGGSVSTSGGTYDDGTIVTITHHQMMDMSL